MNYLPHKPVDLIRSQTLRYHRFKAVVSSRMKTGIHGSGSVRCGAYPSLTDRFPVPLTGGEKFRVDNFIGTPRAGLPKRPARVGQRPPRVVRPFPKAAPAHALMGGGPHPHPAGPP